VLLADGGYTVVGVDLAVMTGNVAQVFRTDDDWARTLQGIHAALRSQGHLVFESRRPVQSPIDASSCSSRGVQPD
jgi:hypothetical protein